MVLGAEELAADREALVRPGYVELFEPDEGPGTDPAGLWGEEPEPDEAAPAAGAAGTGM